MHEWALAEAVIESVKNEMNGRSVLSIDSVVLSLGTLQNVDEDIFREGLSHFLTDDIPLAMGNIVFISEPAGFICRKCGNTWDLQDDTALDEDELESIHFLPEAAHSFVSCPDCGSPDFEIEKGRGVFINEIVFRETE